MTRKRLESWTAEPRECKPVVVAAILALTPQPCPFCGLLKQGDGLLCTVCKREADELNRQIQEENR